MVLGVNEPILGSGCHLTDVIGLNIWPLPTLELVINILPSDNTICHINIISNFNNLNLKVIGFITS